MTARRVYTALAVGLAIGIVIDVAVFWFAAELDSDIFGF
jgi:hypothetical protein